MPVAGAYDRPWSGYTDSDAPAFSNRTFDVRSQFSPSENTPSDPRGLPAKQENFEVVARFGPTHPEFGAVQLGQIADLAVHKGYAYLNSWDDPQCKRGGTFVVDIRNPADPKQVAFIRPKFPFYHGEGAHAISVDVPGFKGDILAVNDESYGSNVPLDPNAAECAADYDGDPATPNSTIAGGFDLYDVSDPANPKVLVQGAGDNDANTPDDPTDDTQQAQSYHSTFIWQAGPRAYLVASDNTELTDVDIYDITNPTAPVEVADLDLADEFPQILDNESANGGLILHHDMIVKQIDGRFILKADYWDAGYVQLDVTDPANPTYVTDTTFDAEDPLRPGSGLTPEGNAHQGEFSFDNQFILAADEDFGVTRPTVQAAAGPQPDKVVVAGTSDGVQIGSLPDALINGPSTFVGDGCVAGTLPAAPADDGDPTTDQVALAERGGLLADGTTDCTFEAKFDNAEAAGYDGIIIFNQANRPDGDPVGGMATNGATIPGVLIRRADALGPQGILSTSTATPPSGTAGPAVEVADEFDGWGYAHLYDAKTSQRLDSYAIPESQDARYATQFGDLSIHEFATDPSTNLAYSSYYAGGMRAFRFSREAGLVPTAAYIEEGGSNFWGVEQFTAPNGERLIAGSDRDFGLVILRYTGPGRVGPTPGPDPDPDPTPTPGPGDPGYGIPGDSFRLRAGDYRAGRLPLRATVDDNGRIKVIAFAKVFRTKKAKRKKNTRIDFFTTRFRGTPDRTRYRVVLRANKRMRRAIRRTRRNSDVRVRIKASYKPVGDPRLRRKLRTRIDER